jgi:hypothetical protein
MYAIYILNRRISRNNPTLTCVKVWSGNKPNINNLHTWGCDVYYYKHKVDRDDKLDETSAKGVFVGYSENNDTYYIVYDMKSNKMIKTRDIKFFEDSFNNMKELYNNENSESNNNNNGNIEYHEFVPDDYIDERYSSQQIENMFQPSKTSNSNSNSQNIGNILVQDTSVGSGKNEATSSDTIDNSSLSNVNNSGSIIDTSTKRTSILSESEKEAINKRTNEIMKRRESIGAVNIKNSTKSKTTVNKNTTNNSSNTNQAVRKSTRPSTVAYKHGDYEQLQNQYGYATDTNIDEHVLTIHLDEPITYNEAVSSIESKQWEKAIKEELDAHEKNMTWTYVDRTNDMNVIGCKWVFKKKKDVNGNIQKFKARLVAKGYNQQYGIDYRDKFAPVLKYKSLRMILALSVIHSNNIDQLDVKTAFLNAQVKEDIYIEAPDGINITDKQVLKLNKALYGIKQAPRE